MIVNVTNLTGSPVTIVRGAAPNYNLAANATVSNLQVDDVQAVNLASQRTQGLISITYVQLPDVAQNQIGMLGRREVTGTTYTLSGLDHGLAVECLNASASVITLPNSLPRGFACKILRYGAGAVTLTAASGATIRFPGAQTGPRAQYSLMDILVRDNVAGVAAEYIIGGDIA